MSKNTPPPLMLLAKAVPSVSGPSALIGLLLAALACVLVTYSFWRLGGSTSDMLVITDYVTTVRDGQASTFGYGGGEPAEAPPQQQPGGYRLPDVLFQSRVMSPVCFSIAKHDGRYFVKGVDDVISVGGERYAKGQEVELPNDSRLRTSGPYGSASFNIQLDEQPDQVRLKLAAPLYNVLVSEKTRLIFGADSEMVSAPIDELLVRTALNGSSTETYVLEKTETGFKIKPDVDLSAAAPPPSELIASLAGNPEKTPQEASFGDGTVVPEGKVRLKFTRQPHSGLGMLNGARLFGLKLMVVVLIFALVFGAWPSPFRGTQIRLSDGPLLFGCVALFFAVGITLAARDYFLPPYNQGRFSEYSSWLLYSAVLLYFVRVPLGEFTRFRWLLSYPLFLIAFTILNYPFDGLVSLPSFKGFVSFTVFYLGVAFAIHGLMIFLRMVLEVASGGDWWRALLLLLPVVLVSAYSLATGGREALYVGGARIHLPTLFLPLMSLVTALVVTCIEQRRTGEAKVQGLALWIVLAVTVVYYLSSRFDHGGTAILGVGVLASAWMASRRSRPWAVTAVAVAGILAAVLVGVFFLHQERLELAWGGEDGAARFFDEAVNLRTARDMARAGGFSGLYDRLYVPSSVSMNIYNDLVAAYLAGFFGFVGLLLVGAAYVLFYSRLLKGTLALLVSAKEPQNSETKTPTPPDKMPQVIIRRSKDEKKQDGEESQVLAGRVVAACAASLVLVFCFQFVWVLSATLNRWVPISGLDLSPISASVISILSFMGLLLASVCFAHNLAQAGAGRVDEKSAESGDTTSPTQLPPRSRPKVRRYGEPQIT